ncbi:hypothetical protein NADFUDRAFT_50313 [Nadsonia fulvescens var. elongata DSM 6958]|uniref:Ubiquitin-domain-containing protein n=1 Tax=Nadsonia fulvescens var. elongata DSM 6958 TaxID=857566 RepID=A0A1E3PMH2_9ASCO|nr:hypothetical protein NADFUDRAFT_50313 [Nadsonia fulvescens var. elongata DSM 6958]
MSEITVTIKSSSDQKYEITISPQATVGQLKEILAEKSGIEVSRQRLIFSGRVLKDDQTLESYKVQNTHTIHLVKGAAPAGASAAGSSTNASSTSNTSPNSNPASSTAGTVPTNFATGAGSSNFLADLTGARYAGLTQLPSASMFGPDGGMGPMPSEDQMLDMLSQPGMQEQMSQMLQNPQVLDMMAASNPQLGPQFRQMMQNPQFREMLTNPEMIRNMMQMQRAFGGMGDSGGMGGGQPAAFPSPGPSGPDDNNTTNANANATPTDSAANPASNPFASLLGGAGAGGANPFASILSGAAPGQQPIMDPAFLQGLLGGSGLGGTAAQQDTRPPEERYESQLRQLNELGFTDFDRNVSALRRSGGNVQGAIEAMLDGHV